MIRRCVAELLGTFAIVFFGCGTVATVGHLGGTAGHLTVNLVFGLTVGAMVFALGHISSAHFNPAVSIAFAVGRKFPWRGVAPYIAAQLIGAVAASALHALFFADRAAAASYGATLPAIDVGRALGIEAVLTFFLMLVIISVATDIRVHKAAPGLAIGGMVALCGLFGGSLTGCSMNPARSLGPALFAGGPALAAYWIYLIGPVIGAVAAVLVYEGIRGDDKSGLPDEASGKRVADEASALP